MDILLASLWCDTVLRLSFSHRTISKEGFNTPYNCFPVSPSIVCSVTLGRLTHIYFTGSAYQFADIRGVVVVVNDITH